MVELAPTPPLACGLALALPTSLSAIERALAAGPYRDYVKRAAFLGLPRAIWESGFDKVAAATITLADTARSLGVMVSTDATLSDLRALFEARSVVTIVAHWRGPDVHADDILADHVAVIDRLEDDDSAVAAAIRSGLRPGWKDWILRAPEGAAQNSRLAEVLDRRMSCEPALRPAPEGTTWHMDASTLRHLNRKALEDWWPQAFAGANQLELADGLHAPENVMASVPPHWSGIADFSNCRSAQLIDGVKQGRSDRMIVANEHETNPLRRMGLLSVVYDLLASGSRNYAEIRIALADGLTRDFGRQGHS